MGEGSVRQRQVATRDGVRGGRRPSWKSVSAGYPKWWRGRGWGAWGSSSPGPSGRMAKSPAGAVTQSLPAKRKYGVGSVQIGPLRLGCGWGNRDVENPGDSSASMLLHHLTPSIQGLPRPRCRERTESRDPRRRSCGGKEGREGQDEGGGQGVSSPGILAEIADQQSRVTCG